MKKEDIDFLKELQHEMLTQNNVGQASPRFWVVRQPNRTYGVDEDYGFDGLVVVNDFEAIAENLKELSEFLEENNCDLNVEYIEDRWDGTVKINYDNEDDNFWEFDTMEELVEFMEEELNYKSIYTTAYKEEDVIVPNTFFLTLRECKEHIEANRHHYHKDAYAYAMTAWRSPQVERLFNILENTDWDNI